jgi:hypothetical protein
LLQPMIHEAIGTCFSGTTYLVTKYIPPAVGYADTSSATSRSSVSSAGLGGLVTYPRERYT